MKTAHAAATTTLVAAVVAVVLPTARATQGSIRVHEAGIAFNIEHYYDDAGIKVHKVDFDNDGLGSAFTFNGSGDITNIVVDGEKYRPIYDSNGDLASVEEYTPSSRRQRRRLLGGVEGEDAEVVEEDRFDQDASMPSEHGRPCECGSDCEEAFHTVCEAGLGSVCHLLEADFFGAPVSPALFASSVTMCETFGAACSALTANAACGSSCHCIPSLHFSLEWFGAGDLDLHVIEPTGIEVYYDDPYGVSVCRANTAVTL